MGSPSLIASLRNMEPRANNERVFRMSFAGVYPHYVTKVEKKGRTKEELHTIIHWLTGHALVVSRTSAASHVADRTR